VPAGNGGNAHITLTAQDGPLADINVIPGGGPGTVTWGLRSAQHTTSTGEFAISPKIRDTLRVSIYYDRQGHDFFTATDITQGTTQTIRAGAGRPAYDKAELAGIIVGAVNQPQPVTPLWQFTDSGVTTYRGDRGTIQGPWTTTALIVTSNGTPSGAVVASPTGLSGAGRDFNVWVPFTPAWTAGEAGYETGGGHQFRFASATLTVPARQPDSIAHGGAGIMGWIALNAPAEQARVIVRPGGGTGSVTYSARTATTTTSGAFQVSPKIGDQLRISIYYDRQGHDFLTVTDITQRSTQTARANVGSQVYFSADVMGSIDNNQVTPPAADIQLWAFSRCSATTYNGDRGTILGPWSTDQFIDTTNATASGPIVMSNTGLRNAGQDFGISLRHR
jgi:hypothetical protein